MHPAVLRGITNRLMSGGYLDQINAAIDSPGFDPDTLGARPTPAYDPTPGRVDIGPGPGIRNFPRGDFLGGSRLGFTPRGSANFTPLAGENWIGGGPAGIDRFTGKVIYNPLGYGGGGFGGASGGLASFGALGSSGGGNAYTRWGF
jgi:hypothetical protein